LTGAWSCLGFGYKYSLVVLVRVVSPLTEITATIVVLSSECVVARPSMKLKNSLTERPSTAEENAIGINLAICSSVYAMAEPLRICA
jgi:hypothetical protein